MSSALPYHEALLHWIWEQRQFNLQSLITNEGQPVEVHNPGQENSSDGPDFKTAELSIGNLRWYGDIEIHWSPGDWRAHGHHTDPNFNNVVLHVVYEETDRQPERASGSAIPTLCLKPVLSQPLHSFLDRYRSDPELPCAGSLDFISEEAFAQQLQKAHKEYFEQKVEDLLEYYDPNLPPSEAWKKMFGIAMADGLGIAHNRSPMRKMTQLLTDELSVTTSSEALRSRALLLSDLRSPAEKKSDFNWKHKGCRPGNHPKNRVQQIADILWHIHQQPFKNWLTGSITERWNRLLKAVTVKPSVGNERASILFGTVFLPAMYSLGNLFHSAKLKTQSWRQWNHHQAAIPGSLLKKLKNTDLSPSLYRQKLGAIYQLRNYCRPRNCQQCKVFKNEISS